MSLFVINEPIRDLLVPRTRRSFQITVGTLAIMSVTFDNHKNLVILTIK